VDLFEAIRLRHSYRGRYVETAIPRRHLDTIVGAAMATLIAQMTVAIFADICLKKTRLQ